MNEAHCWELDRLRHRLQAEEFGHQNFPLIQAIEAAIAALHGSEAGPQEAESIDTYTPLLWVSMTDDQKWAEYLRVRTKLAGSEAGVSARVLEWQDISTAPADSEVFFWVVPKTPEESYCNSSGDPIFSTHPPRLHRGRLKTWSALEKATHWMPLLTPPSAPAPLPAPTGGPMTDARRTAEDRLRESFDLEDLRRRSYRWQTTAYDMESCIQEIDRLRAEIERLSAALNGASTK